MKMTNKFRLIERKVFSGIRRENDSEHSYQLAMLAWYIVSAEDFSLNKDLVIKYALIHDIVEVYAGDTSCYRSDKENTEKKKREKEAINRLKQEFGDFDDLHELIEKYENQEDNESRFVYALDKLVPTINIYLDNGKAWKEFKITFDKMTSNKTRKIAISKEIEPYFKELLQILEENKDMFHEEHKRD